MPKRNLIEIHVKGPAGETVLAADRLVRAAQAKGYEVRMGKTMEGIQTGDGWLAIDFGSRDRDKSVAEISQLIPQVPGGESLLSIGDNGGRGYDWKLQRN